MMLPSRIVLSIAVMMIAFCSHAEGSSKAQITVFRAFPVFDSEGSRRVARSELKCDPCREIVDKRDDDDARYFLNPDAGVQLSLSMIEDVAVESAGEGFVVWVALSAQGKAMISSMIVAHDDFAANFIDGAFSGMVPLNLFDSRYVIAFRSTRSDAEDIARRIR